MPERFPFQVLLAQESYETHSDGANVAQHPIIFLTKGFKTLKLLFSRQHLSGLPRKIKYENKSRIFFFPGAVIQIQIQNTFFLWILKYKYIKIVFQYSSNTNAIVFHPPLGWTSLFLQAVVVIVIM